MNSLGNNLKPVHMIPNEWYNPRSRSSEAISFRITVLYQGSMVVAMGVFSVSDG